MIRSRKQIHVNQGYTRCNLLPLPDNCFITSDKGIYTILTDEGLDVLYVDPAGIQLEGFPNGFIGGVCGVKDRTIYMAGSLKRYKEGQKMKDFFLQHMMTWVELYDGPLIDGGSILFL